MKTSFVAFALAALLSTPVLAEEGESLLIPQGFAVTAGGGAGGFTAKDMRDMTTVCGGWGARVTAGTRSFLGFDVAYAGGLQSIDALGLESDALLLSSTVEGDLRVGWLRPFVESPIQPYFFVGAAWKRYDLTSTDTNTSSVADKDNLVEVPMGLGVSYATSHFIVDLRGGYRPAWDVDLVSTADEGTGLASWNASLQLGYEF